MSVIVPIWEKYTLSIEEAAAYFNIGEGRIRNMINENKNADYVMWKGTHAQIKRLKFEKYIDSVNVI
jgi:excisionase family DNA binding protein